MLVLPILHIFQTILYGPLRLSSYEMAICSQEYEQRGQGVQLSHGTKLGVYTVFQDSNCSYIVLCPARPMKRHVQPYYIYSISIRNTKLGWHANRSSFSIIPNRKHHHSFP